MDALDIMYKEALEPFRSNRGSFCPSTQAELDFLSQTTFKPQKRGGYVIIRRLRNAVLDVKDGYRYGPDIAIKTFSDLDLVFFGGHLRGNVTVRFSTCRTCEYLKCWDCGDGEGIIGVTMVKRTKPGQARILLNAEIIFSGKSCPFRLMMSTLLHEMVHAYDHVVCPGAVKGDGHDEHFGTRISVVHRHAMRILGLSDIARWEPYLQHHFYRDGDVGHWDCGDTQGSGGKARSGGGKGHDRKRENRRKSFRFTRGKKVGEVERGEREERS